MANGKWQMGSEEPAEVSGGFCEGKVVGRAKFRRPGSTDGHAVERGYWAAMTFQWPRTSFLTWGVAGGRRW